MKSSSAAFAVALAVCGLSTGIASAAQTTYQDVRTPDSVAPPQPAAPESQDQRTPDSAVPVQAARPASMDLRSPDSAVPSERVAGTVASDVAPLTGDGWSTLAIVLISTGGALALCMAGFAALRVAHAHQRQPVA
jgi:hypothetical protein